MVVRYRRFRQSRSFLRRVGHVKISNRYRKTEELIWQYKNYYEPLTYINRLRSPLFLSLGITPLS